MKFKATIEIILNIEADNMKIARGMAKDWSGETSTVGLGVGGDRKLTRLKPKFKEIKQTSNSIKGQHE